MRRHARASSSGSNERKPVGQGDPPSGRLRLTILLATVAAFLLVPVAQAAAEQNHGGPTGQFVTVTVSGTGGGEVTSVEGIGRAGFGPGFDEGDPPIECSYASPGPATGTCESEMENAEGRSEYADIFMEAIPSPGSEFVGWTITQGEAFFGCPANGSEEFGQFCYLGSEFGENAKVTAVFNAASGSTNRRTLTITKSAGGSEGIGSVSSKPKGINCGGACDEAVASMYKETPVTLTAKPLGETSHFVEWTGACSGSSTTCTVPMAEDEAVGAVFGGTSKAIINPTPLTFSKGEGSGYGTVKAAGLACEAECTSETVLYQGPITGSKPKPGKLVTLKEVPAFGSELAGWSGCTPISATECQVTMEEAEEVTAEFAAKPTTTLTVAKGGTGTGSVSSKPKAINCGAFCTTQDATVPEGEAIVLKEKPGTEMTFTGWSGGGCSGTAETCTVSLSEATEVTASFSGSPKPIINPQELTLTKAGSGYGTVKAAGMACEVLCTSTVSLYQGPITGSKPKPGKLVTLKAVSAPGSKAVEWSGCTPISATECQVTMEAAEEVTATFNEIE